MDLVKQVINILPDGTICQEVIAIIRVINLRDYAPLLISDEAIISWVRSYIANEPRVSPNEHTLEHLWLNTTYITLTNWRTV